MTPISQAAFARYAHDPQYLFEQGHVGAPPGLDWFWKDPENFALAEGDLCMPFIHVGDGYDCHYISTMGGNKLPAARKMLAWVFTNTSAKWISGSIPRWNLAARLFSRQLGFAPFATWHLPDGEEVRTYILDREAWLSSSPQAHRS